MSENYKYSIQDAFKSLDMIEDEGQSKTVERKTNITLTEKTTSKKKVVKESFEDDDDFENTVVTEDVNNDKIDEEMEKEYKRISELKERYDANPESITAEQLTELRTVGLVEAEQVPLTEDKISITDKEAIEAELAELDSDDEEEPVEQIVDAEADTEEDLRDSYVGSYILECPVCKTLIYKDKENIFHNEEDEEDENVNYGEECPHCKTEDAGFKIIGKVAPIEDEEEETEEDTVEPEETTSEDETASEEPKEEDEEKEVNEDIFRTITDLDDASFDNFATRYLKEVYANVKGFKTTSGNIDEELKTITLEGTITYESGKTRETKFVFETVKPTKRGKIRLVGLNEALSTSKKAYQLVASLTEGTLKIESLIYNYAVKVNEELKKLYGRIA